MLRFGATVTPLGSTILPLGSGPTSLVGSGAASPEAGMKFFMRSLLILFALYALVFAIGDAYLAKLGAPPAGALVFVIVLVGVQYLIAPWLIEHILDIHWEEYGAQLPAPNRAFVEQLCSQRGLKVPRIGIINSGTPNAFSFGRVRSDARVVVTSGLLDVLTPEEANAVLAHEIGHIEHWDFVVMTIAGLVPVLCTSFTCSPEMSKTFAR